jgi:hypothetical protein
VAFSSKSIAIARELAATMELAAEFIEANVLDLRGIVTRKYDVVCTSKRVLCWIGNIRAWARTVASLLRDGVFYMLEGHALVSMFDDDDPDYEDGSYVPVNKTFEWTWSISDVVNALIGRGLSIELLDEHDRTFHRALPGMTRAPDGWWVLRGHQGMIPRSFSLRARKVG